MEPHAFFERNGPGVVVMVRLTGMVMVIIVMVVCVPVVVFVHGISPS